MIKFSRLLPGVQITAAMACLWLLRFESSEFTLAAGIFLLGAVGSWLVPEKFRLHCMALVSLAGLFALFPPATALTILLLSLFSTAVLRIPLALPLRFLALALLSAAVFAALKFTSSSQLVYWSVAAFGAFFTLRSVSYLRETQQRPEWNTWAGALAFFTLLPNCILWFFPLIDYRRFREGAEKPRHPALLQKGLNGICTGLVQLFLYRVLQVTWDLPLQYVASYGDLFHFLIITYLHYIRISGAFHLIVGIIALYGVDLPRTHTLYLFARGALDLARRLNTYWKDFMARQIYRPWAGALTPALGKKGASALALIGVFCVSCLLHPFVYLWSRGFYLLRLEDVLFWLVLAVWCLLEIYFASETDAEDRPGFKDFLQRAFQITLCFFIFSVVWAVWNSPDAGDLVALAWLAKWRGLREIWPVLIYPAVGLTGAAYFFWLGEGEPRFRFREFFNLVPLAVMGFFAWPGFQQAFPQPVAALIRNVANPDFQNEYEAEKRAYDYYEGFKSSQIAAGDEDEQPIEKQPYFQALPDYRRRELRAGVDTFFMRQKFVTNRWGMASLNDYPLEKPEKHLRVALIGASNSMAYGIQPGLDWPSLAEKWFREHGHPEIEILNFSVIGYSSLLLPYVFEKKVIPFNPDVLVYAGGAREYAVNGFNAGWALRNRLEVPYPDLFPVLGVTDGQGFLARHYFTVAPFETQVAIFDWGLTKLGRLAAGVGAARMYFLTPALYEGNEEAHWRTRMDEKHMLKTAAEAGFQVYDASRTLEGRRLEDMSLLDDRYNYNHLSPEAHALMAGRFVEDFSDFLKTFKGNP